MENEPSEEETRTSRLLLTDAIYECRILIVEDSATSRDNISEVLSNAGYTNLDFACDGVEAIAKVSTMKPDLMILDIVMPRLNLALIEHPLFELGDGHQWFCCGNE